MALTSPSTLGLIRFAIMTSEFENNNDGNATTGTVRYTTECLTALEKIRTQS